MIPGSLIAADRRHHTCLRDAREHCRPLQAARQVPGKTGSQRLWSFHHHGFYYNATPEATPKRPMARPRVLPIIMTVALFY